MATKLLLFFTANQQMTASEKVNFDRLVKVSEKPFDIVVINKERGSANYGEGRPIPADFISGVAPLPEYIDGEGVPIYTQVDPDFPVIPNMPSDMATVSNGEQFEVGGTTFEYEVVDSKIVNIKVVE